MFKIVAEEQGWLDSFNARYGTDYKQGDVVGKYDDVISVIDPEVATSLEDTIYYFNHTFAQGEAIWLEEVNEMDNIQELVIKWAEVRGLGKANPAAQMIKAQEELGELAAGFNKKDMKKFIDSLGDLQVVLIILSAQMDVSYKDSLISAYNEIKDRKGMMIGDSFVKYADLSDEDKAAFDERESK